MTAALANPKLLQWRPRVSSSILYTNRSDTGDCLLVHACTEVNVRVRRDTLCQRHDFYVDVERLGWADTVIYPRRFNIRYCAGRCPLAAQAHGIDASSHAVFRAVARGHRRRRAPAPPSPCCVATSLRPMNLLYRDKQQGHIDIWQLDDVIADACGCR